MDEEQWLTGYNLQLVLNYNMKKQNETDAKVMSNGLEQAGGPKNNAIVVDIADCMIFLCHYYNIMSLVPPKN